MSRKAKRPEAVLTGRNIATMRDLRGMTQDELGRHVGAHKQTVSRWETGDIMAPVDKLTRIAQALGVETSWLISEGDLEAESLSLALGEDAAVPSALVEQIRKLPPVARRELVVRIVREML